MDLVVEDFVRFSTGFSAILLRLLPTAQEVYFLKNEVEVGTFYDQKKIIGRVTEDYQKIFSKKKKYLVRDSFLFIPFDISDQDTVVAVVCGADPLFLTKVSDDWLGDVHDRAGTEMLLLKQARTDPQTGLLNQSNLYSLLENYKQEDGLLLLLVHLPAKRSTLGSVHRHISFSSSMLKYFSAGRAMVHYLGHSVFALVYKAQEGDNLDEVENKLLLYLKKGACHKVYIGSSRVVAVENGQDGSVNGVQLLDQAWTALHHATRKGPFSFCDYDVLAFPEKHPLAPPEKSLARKLQRRWSGLDRFSLVQFSNEDRDYASRKIAEKYLDDVSPIIDGQDIFVIIAGDDIDGAVNWAEKIVDRVAQDDTPTTVAAGIGHYPYSDFKKAELPLNCRKALVHGSFLGPSSVVVFDPVSLNISGDIYYGDGDFNKAIGEYSRAINVGKGDINLYNSLGVAYAMTGKLKEADGSFRRALKLEKDNFMALYNLGLVLQNLGRTDDALEFLATALASCRAQGRYQEHLNELRLQLGILSSRAGQFLEGPPYLEKWLETNGQSPRASEAYFHLGKMYYLAGKNQKAMTALQRALRTDEFNDGALSLLGKIYLDEEEGREIALSLCLKSVELEPADLEHQVYLAEALVSCNRFEEAKPYLYRCVRNKKLQTDARLLLAQGYLLSGQFTRAREWYQKVIATSGVEKNKLLEARSGISACSTPK